MTMLAYHNDPDLKSSVLAGLAAHRAADEIIQGHYWFDVKNKRGEDGDRPARLRGGCAIGCVLHDLDPTLSPSDHYQFERQLGIPSQIANLIDAIFEAQPDQASAADWSIKVMDAIPVGAVLTGVWDRFALWMLRDLVARTPDQEGIASNMAGLFDRVVHGNEPTDTEWARAVRDAHESGDVGNARVAWNAAKGRAPRGGWSAYAAWDDWLVRVVEKDARRSADVLVALLAAAPIGGKA